MFQQIVIALLLLAIIIPIGAFFIGERKVRRFKTTLAVNIISFFAILLFSTVVLFSGDAFAAEAAAAAISGDAAGMVFLGAALSTGLGSIGAGIATGSAASAALGALSENDGIMGKALIFVALAEGIAIYGLIIAFMILNKVG
jgi:V/A-type H+-transporting ATPase subunit K